MIRKGNGWLCQKLIVSKDKLVMTDIGDWDLRHVVENKIMNEIIKTSGE